MILFDKWQIHGEQYDCNGDPVYDNYADEASDIQMLDWMGILLQAILVLFDLLFILAMTGHVPCQDAMELLL